MFSSYDGPNSNYSMVYGYMLNDKSIDKLIATSSYTGDGDGPLTSVEKSVILSVVLRRILNETLKDYELCFVSYGGQERLCIALGTNVPGELPVPKDPNAHCALAARLGQKCPPCWFVRAD